MKMKDIDKINKFIDSPYFLNPAKHRKWFHDKTTALALFLITKNPRVPLVQQLHVALDKIFKKKKPKK